MSADDTPPDLGTDQWSEPEPLEAAPDLPTFPIEALPTPVREWVEATTAALQVPTDMVALSALGVLAAATVGRVRVALDERETCTEPTCLYVAVVAEPGERKSPLLRAALAPLGEALSKLRESHRSRLADTETATALRGRADAKRKEAAKCADETDRDTAVKEAIDLDEQAEAIDPGASPRLWTGDATAEALESLLADHGGRFAIISDEGGTLGTLGRYSTTAEPNLDVLLKGWDASPLIVDRRSRQVEVAAAVLTLVLMLQRHQLAVLESGAFAGRGLAPRFLYAWPATALGTRSRLMTAGVTAEVRDAWHGLVGGLVADLWDESEPTVVAVSAEAFAALERFHVTHEVRLGPGGDLYGVNGWAAKLPGEIARIAGLFHLCASGWRDREPQVSGPEMDAAITVGRYLIPHAAACLGLVTEPADVTAARRLWAWVERHGGPPSFRLRDAYVSLGMSPEAAKAGIRQLAERHLVRRLIVSPSPQGGRPPEVYEIHPNFTGNNHHNHHNSGSGSGSGGCDGSAPGDSFESAGSGRP